MFRFLAQLLGFFQSLVRSKEVQNKKYEDKRPEKQLKRKKKFNKKSSKWLKRGHISEQDIQDID